MIQCRAVEVSVAVDAAQGSRLKAILKQRLHTTRASKIPVLGYARERIMQELIVGYRLMQIFMHFFVSCVMQEVDFYRGGWEGNSWNV